MLIRSRYSYDAESYSRSSGLACKEPSMTIQSQKDEADINVLVKRFGITGMMPQGVRVPTYGDFESAIDFKSAQLAIIEANRSFMSMPADTRARFNNDPQRFLEFCAAVDGAGKLSNLDEMRKLGLAVPAPPEAPPPA